MIENHPTNGPESELGRNMDDYSYHVTTAWMLISLKIFSSNESPNSPLKRC